jgi:hypothetical protein
MAERKREAWGMSFALRDERRCFRFLIALFAVIGLEFDVLCNPFAPTLILHWLMSSRLNPPTSAEDVAWEYDLFDLLDASSEPDGQSQDGNESPPTGGAPQFGVTPEIAEAIGIRPPSRAPLRVITGAPGAIAAARVEPINGVREPSSPMNPRLSIQARLCRFRC